MLRRITGLMVPNAVSKRRATITQWPGTNIPEERIIELQLCDSREKNREVVESISYETSEEGVYI